MSEELINIAEKALLDTNTDISSIHSRFSALAEISAELLNWDAALHFYKAAIAAHPGDVDILCRMGLVYWNLGGTEDAVNMLLRAYRIDPENGDVVEHAAGILGMFDRKTEACELLERYLEKHPQDLDRMMQLATLRSEADTREDGDNGTFIDQP